MANILTPDQRLRVFVSSTLQELADERKAARSAVEELRLSPVMFELGARPHPPRNLYRAYLEQSHIFVGIYWQRYGWIAPDETISGLEDEYRLCGNRPKLMYVKTPAPEREEKLKELLEQIQRDDEVSYRPFSSAEELIELLENDLALLLTERFAASLGPASETKIRNPQPHDTFLPSAQTELIGREDEIGEVSRLLLQPHTRLLTLQGPGGVGKSRLGIEVAQHLSPHFTDGVVFVALASVTDPDLLLPTLADTLEVEAAAGVSRRDTLKQHLQGKNLLLLLDNFEQLATASRELSNLLVAAPHLKILVTSRSRLHLSAEHVYEVQPLEPPKPEELNWRRMKKSRAVRLFEVRAKAVKSDFVLNPENLPTVAEICRQLDGLPLAIELAAAQLRLLSPQALLKRLSKRFEFLTSGANDLPDRQQTLRNTIDWSYTLLTEAQSELFRRLGVFASGFSLEAAEIISGEAIDAFESVAALVDKSMIRSGESEGEPYFTMLESIRAYSEEKLAERPVAEQVRELHATYFLELAKVSREGIAGPDQNRWLKRSEIEHPNFRRALSWLIEVKDIERAGQLAYALARFWMIRGHVKEGRDWLSKVRAAGNEVTSKTRSGVLIAAAVLADEAGEPAEALLLHEENIALCRTLGERQGLANSLTSLASLWYEQGEYERSRAVATESLGVYRDLGDAWGEAAALNNLSVVANNLGEYDLAEAHAEHALAITRQLGDEHGTASPLVNLGVLNLFRKDYKAAHTKLGEALGIYSSVKDERNVAVTLELIARVALEMGMAERAAQLLGATAKSWEMSGARGSSSDVTEAQKTLDDVRQALGEDFDAAWNRGRALSLEKAVRLAKSDVA